MPADRLPPDYYAVLGVPETATDEEIARAYRRLARLLHPDANAGSDAARFRDATDAYDVIGDRVRRDAYDASRRRAPSHRGTSIPVRGPSHRASARELVLSFEEAMRGTTAQVQVDETGSCPTCGGSGREMARATSCPACDGSGERVRQSGGITIRQRCGDCDGTGRPAPAVCGTCRGTGVATSSRPVTVRIPPGVDDGSTVRIMLRRGVEPASTAIHATVRVRPHGYFRRQGRDISLTVPITVAEAALGAEIQIPSLDGRGHQLRIPPGTDHGRTFRVAGGGVPDRNNPGDLLVTVEVVVPKSLSEGQRRALEDFAANTESPRTQLWGDETRASP